MRHQTFTERISIRPEKTVSDTGDDRQDREQRGGGRPARQGRPGRGGQDRGGQDRRSSDRAPRDGERRPWLRDDRSSSSSEGRPYRPSSARPERSGERKPYSRDGGGERKPYSRDGGGERKPYSRDGGGERKPYSRDGGAGERKPYSRDGGGERKPYSRDGGGERKPYSRDGGGERKPYSRDGGGERKPYSRDGGDRGRRDGDQKLWTHRGAPARGDRDAQRAERQYTEEELRQRELRSVRPEHDDPEIPESVTPNDLERVARNELKTLSKENADGVARHLAMAAMLIDEDPALAHRHAVSAARRAGRIAVVRETLAITAYATGDFALALRELRTQRRISGSNDQLALMVDSERGVGRPERALELGRSVPRDTLPVPVQVAVAIAMSGARLDLGQPELALAELEIPQLDPTRAFSYSPALFDAYAEVLEELGREDDARVWRDRAVAAAEALDDSFDIGADETIEIIEVDDPTEYPDDDALDAHDLDGDDLDGDDLAEDDLDADDRDGADESDTPEVADEDSDEDSDDESDEDEDSDEHAADVGVDIDDDEDDEDPVQSTDPADQDEQGDADVPTEK
ncbi:hypothetical protein ACFDTO_27940 [Microbacteriaceae bacterium 4G12]